MKGRLVEGLHTLPRVEQRLDRIEVEKMRSRSGDVGYTVALVWESGARSMTGLYSDLPAALDAARKRAREHSDATVQIVGARFHVGIQRLDEDGNRVTVADATSALATARLRYVPVIAEESGTVVLRLTGSADLPSALEEGRAFAEAHALGFDDNISP